MFGVEVLQGDCLEQLANVPEGSAHMCVTSPPYWGLRDYGVDGQLGLEKTPDEYVEKMVAVFRQVRRVLRDDGTLWLNLGDSYAGGKQGRGDTGAGYLREGRTPAGEPKQRAVAEGFKPKDLVGIPWRVAFALQADGWFLRQDIIWHKPNPMPESVKDRCTKAHEYIFLLAKSPRYFYDVEAIKEPSVDPESHRGRTKRNPDKFVGQKFSETRAGFANMAEGKTYPTRIKRSVWTVSTKPYRGAHFAVFPPDLIEPCILAGCPLQACAACGRGYERVVERTREATRPGKNCKYEGTGVYHNPERHVTTTVTLGFRPACECGSRASVSGVVLDPFGGSGTTAEVAVKLGRRALLTELNPEYVELIGKRLSALAEREPLFCDLVA